MNKHKEFSLLKNLIDKHSIRDYLSKYYFLIEDIDHNHIIIHHVIFLNFKIHIFYSRNLIISNKIVDNNKILNQEQNNLEKNEDLNIQHFINFIEKEKESKFQDLNFHFSINIDFFKELDIYEREEDNNIDIKVDDIYLIEDSFNNLNNFLLNEKDNNNYLREKEVNLNEDKKDGLYLSFSFINFNKKLYEELLQLIKSHND